MRIDDKWIQLGYTAKLVLRIVDILEATYYYRKNKAFQEPRVYHGGRPICVLKVENAQFCKQNYLSTCQPFETIEEFYPLPA
jgi:hypothetical protein